MYGLLKDAENRKTSGELQVISTVIQQVFERTAHMVPFHETLLFVESFIEDNLPNIDVTALTAFRTLVHKEGYMDVMFLGDDDDYEFSDLDEFDQEFDVEKDPETGMLHVVRKEPLPEAESDEEVIDELDELLQRIFTVAQVLNSLRDSSNVKDGEPGKGGVQ